MINNINEGPLRAAAKIDPGGTIHDREISQQQAAEARQVRPVENSEAGNKADAKNSHKKDQSKYVVEDNTLVFEKYNQKGDLIFRLPPDYKPVDERV
jgi:hypothetical protein